MTGTSRIETFLWFLFLTLVGISVYYTGLQIPYYSDDFKFFFYPPPSGIFYYFFHPNSFNTYAYRPVEASVLTFIQIHWGLNTLPIHLTGVLLNVIVSWIIYRCMMQLDFSRAQAALGSLFMVVSQANVHAVLSNDAMSQVFATFFGCACLWFLYNAFFTAKLKQGNYHYTATYLFYFLSVVMFGLSLFSKETGISFLLSIGLLVFIHEIVSRNSQISLKKAILVLLPFLIVCMFYLIARLLIVEQQPSFGTGRYQFRIGLNIIRNIMLYYFSAVIPVSSVTFYKALYNREFLKLSLFVVSTLIFLLFVVYGVMHSDKRKIVYLICMLVFISSFPVVLLNHVSELYVHNSMPFVSMFVGIGLGDLYESVRPHLLKRSLLFVLTVLLLFSHGGAIRNKANLMQDNGERATELLQQIKQYAAAVPANGKLYLLNPSHRGFEYSVFLFKGFSVLKFGLHRINQISKRDDIEIILIEESEKEQHIGEDNTLFLSLRDKKSEVYRVR